MIKIVDYGLGNLLAFQNIYKQLNIPFGLAKNTDDLKKAKGLILPGVGSFDTAINMLNESGMRPRLDELVQINKLPILGICIGMQILAEKSEEGNLSGLGWIPGKVKKFKKSKNFNFPLPHMGWNNVKSKNNKLFSKLDKNNKFYFLHSFYFECTDQEDIAATSNYGNDFSCAVNSENIFGVQFHPEKSHQSGVLLLKNFAEITNC